MVLIPSPPRPISNRTFLPKDGGDDGDVAVDLFLLGRDLSVGMCTLKSGIWGVCTKISMELPEPEPTTIGDMLLPVNSKIYMATDAGFILVLDLVAASFSVLQLPDRVKTENFRLSCGEASGLFLIHADGYQLSVWHHETDGNGTCDWTLVYDAVCVHEACNRHEDVLVMGANGNAEFVLLALEASGVLICMQLSRTEKILYHEMDLRHVRGSCIVPFMMVWPPIFLTINQEE
uniref:F-box protein AT5G49610-like beta-propeller domain-containing protein n=1 Tax=Arundo donax TaxID=35708 RepID=A0A0A8YPC8_ARUDO